MKVNDKETEVAVLIGKNGKVAAWSKGNKVIDIQVSSQEILRAAINDCLKLIEDSADNFFIDTEQVSTPTSE